MKILFVTTISVTLNTFLCPHIRMLVAAGHTVDVAANMTTPVAPDLVELGCGVFDIPFQRAVLSRGLWPAWRQLRSLVRRGQYDMVHTHTPVASALVRWACRDLPGTRVVYTAHGFHFYTGAPLANWLVYYPVEWFLARYTDLLITINAEDYSRAQSSLRARAVVQVPGVGLDVARYHEAEAQDESLWESLGLPAAAVVLLSVGELSRRKNHGIVIRSLARIADQRVHYVICGTGDKAAELSALARELGVGERVHLPGHRSDVVAFYRHADLFVFPSLHEGLPVALMEAMAAGMSVVGSAIRGNDDLIRPDLGGSLLAPTDVEGFAREIAVRLTDADRRRREGLYNLRAVQPFDLASVLAVMRELYDGEACRG